MTAPRLKIADLDEARLAKLHALEDELGSYIVALEPQYPFVELSEEQLKRLRSLEQELDVILLAYRKN